MTYVTRRELLGRLGAASATPLCPSFALAASPTSHTFKLEEFEITILSDGHLMIPTQFLARNVSEEEIKARLGQTGGMVTPASNVTLVWTPSDLILIDVGAGPHFMPTAGKLADNMEAAGIDRKAITKEGAKTLPWKPATWHRVKTSLARCQADATVCGQVRRWRRRSFPA